MKEQKFTTTITVCEWQDLSAEQQKLVCLAKEQTKNSYCPYSKFHVGAAALLGNGAIVMGCNQENAAYPSGLCAERTALFSAGAQYPTEPVVKLAIACYTNGHFTQQPGAPCGSCRQVMVETEQRYHTPIEVILYGDKETYVLRSASELLPLVFESDLLDE